MLLLFVLLQSQSFYEHYEQGVAFYDSKDYPAAIRAFETAIAIRPESGPKVRTTGVQLKPYFPYQYLASAHFFLSNAEQAREYIRLSYRFNENDDKGIAEKLSLMEQTLDNKQPEPQESPDFSSILQLIEDAKYKMALSQIEKQIRQDPEHTKEYADFVPLIQQLLKGEEEQKVLKEKNQQNLDNNLKKAQSARAQGDWVEAFIHYSSVAKVDPNHSEAQEFLDEYAEKWSQVPQEQLDGLREELEQAQSERNEFEKQRDALAEEKERLRSQIRSIERELREQPTEIVLKEPSWSFERIEGEMFQVSVDYESNQLITSAKILVNSDQLFHWEELNRAAIKRRFQVALPLEENLIELYVTTKDGDARFPYPYKRAPVQRPNLGNNKSLKWVMLGFCLVLILSYWILQKNQRRAFRQRFNPYIAGAPILKNEMFYGRASLLRQILNTIHNNSLMIYGERRIGKTSFLHQLNNALPTLQDAEYQFFPVIIDLQGVEEDHFFRHIEDEIHAVLSNHGIQEPASPCHDGRSFARNIRQSIHDLKSNTKKTPKIVLLLDEVDVMNAYSEKTNQQLRAVFMKGFAKHLVAIMAGIHISKRWKSEGSPWYNFFEQIELKPFSKEQAVDLITQPVKGIYFFDQNAVDRILELSHGKPYIIQKICVNLIAFVMGENKRKISIKDVEFVFNQIHKEVEGHS